MVRAADRHFESLSGWSVLELAGSLTAEQLRETQYAQPLTFLVQVGLLHLLEHAGIRPHMVRQAGRDPPTSHSKPPS